MENPDDTIDFGDGGMTAHDALYDGIYTGGDLQDGSLQNNGDLGLELGTDPLILDNMEAALGVSNIDDLYGIGKISDDPLRGYGDDVKIDSDIQMGSDYGKYGSYSTHEKPMDSYRVVEPPPRAPHSSRVNPMKDYPFSTKPLDPTIEHFMPDDDEIDYYTINKPPKPVRPLTTRESYDLGDFERSPYFSRPFTIYKVKPPSVKRPVKSVRASREAPLKMSSRYCTPPPQAARHVLRGGDYTERTKDDNMRSKQFEKNLAARYKMEHPLHLYKLDNLKMFKQGVLNSKAQIMQKERAEYETHMKVHEKKRAIAERRRKQLLRDQELYEIRMGQGCDDGLEARVCSYRK